MRFNTSSGARSISSRFNVADFSASARSAGSAIDTASGFISSRRTLAGTATNGVRSGVSVKQSNIGQAAASNTFIGLMPRICSIVRSTLVVLYCVDTTAPRLQNGLAT
jgi:hypothetical protein